MVEREGPRWDCALLLLHPKFPTFLDVKLVKNQINGKEHIVLKENASMEDLRQEADRMRALGYDLKAEERLARYVATHKFYQGRFLLALETE